jgi:hypothetical protein
MRATPIALALSVLAAQAAFASAPNWILIGQGGGASVSIDVNSIKSRGGRLSAWAMFDYAKNQYDEASRKMYRSIIQLNVYDCKDERTGVASMTSYSENSGAGDVIRSAELEISTVPLSYQLPGSLGASMIESVCAFAAQAPAAKPPSSEKDGIAAPAPKTS